MFYIIRPHRRPEENKLLYDIKKKKKKSEANYIKGGLKKDK